MIVFWLVCGLVVSMAADFATQRDLGERLSDAHPWYPVVMVVAWPLFGVLIVGGVLDKAIARLVIEARFWRLRREVDRVLEDL